MAKRLAQLSSEYKIDLSPEIFNDRYYPHLQSIHRWEIFFGGRGSGKSTFIAQKLALQMTTMEGRNLLCLRKQGKDCRMSSFNEIRGALEKFNLVDLWRISESPEPKMVHRINKNTMIFTGMDDIQDVKSIKFENGNCTDVWYEEVTQEPDKKTITDLNNGLRDRKLKSRVILSFNPISRSHWLFDFVTKDMKLRGVDSLILQTTYKDNKFLPSDYAAELERLKYTDPYSYQVDALGDWGQTGQTVFNANKVGARLAELASLEYKKAEFSYEKDDMGRFDPKSTRIFYHADGETKIFKEPEEGVPYVIAFDTAGEGSDYYAAHVVDNITGEQVAVYHSVRDPSDCIIQIFALGHYYNYALLCPEVNFDSYPLKKLLEWGYHKIYTRESAVDRTDSIYEQKLGFRTTSANRQQMLSELVEWVNENTHLINDADTLNEMLTFTRQSRKQKGIFWAAENGAHDDLCFVKGTLILTDKGQVPIEKIKIGDMVLTRDGFKPVEVTTSQHKPVITKLGLTGTPNHPVITTTGTKPLAIVSDSDILYMWNEQLSLIQEESAWNVKQLLTMENSTTDTQNPKEDNLEYISGDTTSGNRHHLHCTDKCGLMPLEKSQKGMLSTTKTETRLITPLTILNVLKEENIAQGICFQKKDEKSLWKTVTSSPKDLCDSSKNGNKIIQKELMKSLFKMALHSRNDRLLLLKNGWKTILSLFKKSEVKMGKNRVPKDGARIEKVYNLQVRGTHEYFANNILVHNCMAFAIVLQAREQQIAYKVKAKVKKGGVYLMEDIEKMFKRGEISSDEKKELMKISADTYGDYGSAKMQRSSARYAR